MNLSVTVMAHPSRKAFVDELVPHLDGRVLRGSPSIVWDRMNDRWDTGRRSQLDFDPAADWHLVVQDDALVCPDFIEGVHAALAAVPDNPVAFYLGRVRPYHGFMRRVVGQAQREGKSWLAMPGPWWGVALAVPTARIEQMIEWCDPHTEIENYDRRMAAYWKSIGVACWYSIPSLVNHRSGESNPSLIPGRDGRHRVAFAFIGDRSPLEVDWNTGALHSRGPAQQLTGAARRPRTPERRGQPSS